MTGRDLSTHLKTKKIGGHFLMRCPPILLSVTETGIEDYFRTFLTTTEPSFILVTTMLMPSNGLSLEMPAALM